MAKIDETKIIHPCKAGEFFREDVLTLARAVADDFAGFYDDALSCDFCNGEEMHSRDVEDFSQLPHDPDCPVLIAKDILTRQN